MKLIALKRKLMINYNEFDHFFYFHNYWKSSNYFLIINSKTKIFD